MLVRPDNTKQENSFSREYFTNWLNMETKINKNYSSYVLIKNQDIFDSINTRIGSGKDGCSVIVPHVCNNVNAFGAGFAGQVALKYPEVKMNFHMLGSQAKLGHTQFVSVKSDKQYRHSIIFANMISQNKLISNTNRRPINYAALVYSMNQVKQHIKTLQSNMDSKIEIHAPKFGSGLAGGDWKFISHLIDDIWFDISVYIYTK